MCPPKQLEHYICRGSIAETTKIAYSFRESLMKIEYSFFIPFAGLVFVPKIVFKRWTCNLCKNRTCVLVQTYSVTSFQTRQWREFTNSRVNLGVSQLHCRCNVCETPGSKYLIHGVQLFLYLGKNETSCIHPKILACVVVCQTTCLPLDSLFDFFFIMR